MDSTRSTADGGCSSSLSRVMDGSGGRREEEVHDDDDEEEFQQELQKLSKKNKTQ